MPLHKKRQYSALESSKKALLLSKVQKKSDKFLQQRLLDLQKGGRMADKDGAPRANRRGTDRNNVRVRFSKDVMKGLQAKLDVYGYSMKADEISLEVRKLWAEKPEIFVSKHVRGYLRFGLYHPNRDGTQGGFVEVTCHLHGENHVSPGSMVLGGGVLSDARITGGSTVHGSKIDSSKVFSSQINGHSVLVNCKATLCGAKDSVLSRVRGEQSYFDRCNYSDRSFRNERHVNNVKVENQAANGKKSWEETIVELERCAWKAFSVLDEEPIKEDSSWRDRTPVIYRNL